MRRIPLSETQIDRRVEFLIKEVRSESPIRDQTVTYAFRVITNYFSVNDDVSSKKLRLNCPYRSRKAYELSVNRPESWLNDVTNEHQYPIKRAWEWMRAERDSLSVQCVKDHLRKWPIVVVTKDENNLLRDHPEIEPDQRYRVAGIEVLKKTGSETWEAISPDQF